MNTSEVKDICWNGWDLKLFERVLAACPTKKAQSDFINSMCRICMSDIKKSGGATEENYDAPPARPQRNGNINTSRDGYDSENFRGIYNQYDYADDYYKK